MDSTIPNKGKQEGGRGPILVARRERETRHTAKIYKFEWTDNSYEHLQNK